MISTRKWLADFTHQFFPHYCVGCGSDLVEEHQYICHQCFATLPETYFAPHSNNPIEKIFYGRVDVQEAMAAYYFSKQSVLQNLIHTLKYKTNQEVGLQLGRWMGALLKSSHRFNNIDALVPLPLFPEKQKKRGYNQSAVLCRGISEILNVPVKDDFIIRKRYTDTQTRKGRSERWKNVDGSFEINRLCTSKPNHVLLVDDVITTGATLEACSSSIVDSGVKLSVAVLAWSSDD
jgi:ComF family protein